MLFTDQRWVDFAVLFPHEICRDVGCNVAYWNVWGRALTRNAGGEVLVDGGPLRFFHFSGFDPMRPHLLSVHQGDEPRVRLPDRPVLGELCRAYARSLLDAGHLRARRSTYGWGTTGTGVVLTPSMRRAFRRGVLEAEAAGVPSPPGPFDADGGSAFADWLCEPDATGGVRRLLLGRWELDRSLRTNFPDPLGEHAAAYLEWARAEEWAHRGAAPDCTTEPRASVGPSAHGPW